MKRAAAAIQQWRTSGTYMSREAVASALGKSLSTVVRWENERTSDPRLSELLEMEKLKPGLLTRLLPAENRRSGSRSPSRRSASPTVDATGPSAQSE